MQLPSSFDYACLSMYTECPLKYKFHFIDELGSIYKQDHAYFSFGESIHTTLAELFSIREIEQRTLPALLNILEKHWISCGYASKEEETDWKSQAQSLLVRFYDSADIAARPVCIEEYFNVSLNGSVITGKIDRVDKHKGGYEIIDYKTRRTLPLAEEIENDFQLAICQLACAKKFGFIPEKLSLYFLQFDKIISTYKCPENISLTEKKIEKIISAINADKYFIPTPNKYCNWCDYNIICPAMGIGLEVIKPSSSISGQQDESLKKVISHLELIRNDLYALNRTVSEFAGILDKTFLVNKLLDVFLEVSKSNKGFILLKSGDSFQISAAKGFEKQEFESDIKFSDSGFDTTEIITSADSLKHRIPFLKSCRVPCLILPLRIRERRYGYVFLFDKKNKLVFDNYDTILLSNLSGMASISLNNADLYEAAIRDGMTGLYVHSYFQNRLETEMFRAKRYNSDLSLLMIDLDYFKKINDVFGHPTGDKILKRFAEILRGNIRKVDIGARYGGEEFAVILPETNISGAAKLAENLRFLVEKEEFLICEQRIPITISIGAACWDKISNRQTLLKQADMSLYKAKSCGRNRVCLFE